VILCPRCKKIAGPENGTCDAWDEAQYRDVDHDLVYEEKMHDYPHENPNDCIRHLSDQIALLATRLERLEPKS